MPASPTDSFETCGIATGRYLAKAPVLQQLPHRGPLLPAVFQQQPPVTLKVRGRTLHQRCQRRLILPRKPGQVGMPQQISAVVMMRAVIDEDSRFVELCASGQQTTMTVSGESPLGPYLIEEP